MARTLNTVRLLLEENRLGGAWVVATGLLHDHPGYKEAQELYAQITQRLKAGEPLDPPLTEDDKAALYR